MMATSLFKLTCGVVLVVLVSLQGVVPAKLQALKLPSYIKKICYRDDPKVAECIRSVGQEVIPRIAQGDPKYRVPVLQPLMIRELTVNQGTRQVGMKMACTNCSLYGLEKGRFVEARPDFKNNKGEWDFHFDTMNILGKYKVSGQVLLLPIVGEGDANFTMTDISCTFKFSWYLEKRANGLEYVRLKSHELPFKIGGMQVQLENLFNGDRLLGDNMNRFINENWREILKEVAPAIGDALGDMFSGILNSISNLVPYDNQFPKMPKE